MFVSALIQFILIGRSAGGGGGAGAFFPGGSGGEIEGIDDHGNIHSRTTRDGGKKVVARRAAWRDVWLGGGVLGEALSGFVLGWAGVGGVLR